MNILKGFSIPAWRDRAACKEVGIDPTWWFPKDANRKYQRMAIAVCCACPVRSECLEYSITLPEPHGIWGGLTETQRRIEIARRNREASSVA